MTYKEAIEKELEINFKISFEEASKRIEGLKEKTFNNVKSQWKKHNGKISGNNGKKPKKSIPPQNTPTTKELAHIIESIDNPVAFASAHIFKKMIETGDVRWAQLYVSVLDKTNKLDYETIREQEWLKQAANMSMEDLVSKVAVKGFTSRNISRRLDEAEDTSIYDNF